MQLHMFCLSLQLGLRPSTHAVTYVLLVVTIRVKAPSTFPDVVLLYLGLESSNLKSLFSVKINKLFYGKGAYT